MFTQNYFQRFIKYAFKCDLLSKKKFFIYQLIGLRIILLARYHAVNDIFFVT